MNFFYCTLRVANMCLNPLVLLSDFYVNWRISKEFRFAYQHGPSFDKEKWTMAKEGCISLFLFVWSLSTHSRNFHLYGDVTIAGEGLQILTHARHSWQLIIEGSLTCHTYCDTGLPFIMVISEDPWHSHLLPSVCQWSCHYLFLRLRSVATGDRIRAPAGCIRNP